ncbi:MAG: prenyltransferase/squalene oxidase repeat-containing protein [Ilumatobacter sp.]|uniref:prenyltransferase/squalene oxidase repeat-containing protein n=1 Tax=Ilumatobacter sp. TaxID=1967498 RepID=UPI002625BB26|nr:prenyltransferase/squalene oxidase repeat-containing protein [Ilumatobacter sp.]MDJ0770672.1 prenyltransferase/squalene oxidase repeat-containing protein [Ilumatobacter sp.]
MTTIPDLPGVLSRDDVIASGEHLASLQTDSGMIPWFPGGHCDPWNHVESAMALDVAGFHAEAERAYEWLADIQRADGSWHNYYLPDGDRDDTVEDDKLDTNVCAYIATGVWHHWRCTGDRGFVDNLWPTVERALDWVLSLRRRDGLVLWAIEPEAHPWNYALLTGSASVQHALRCGAATGLETGSPRPDWVEAADVMCTLINHGRRSFQPKTRWAMDWYYPVLTGATTDVAAKARLADGWERFAMEGLGIRCVEDEPWVTASETAEASLAYAAIGDFATATDLLAWTRGHRQPDGGYLTGLVHPERLIFPDGEHTSYTAAAVILAADAIVGASPASDLFVSPSIRTADG